jgi:hypothetical protein
MRYLAKTSWIGYDENVNFRTFFSAVLKEKTRVG